MALPDLSLYLVLDPVLCGGADGMVSTAVAAAQEGPALSSSGLRTGRSGSSRPADEL